MNGQRTRNRLHELGGQLLRFGMPVEDLVGEDGPNCYEQLPGDDGLVATQAGRLCLLVRVGVGSSIGCLDHGARRSFRSALGIRPV